MSRTEPLDDVLLFKVVELFLVKGHTAKKTADLINAEKRTDRRLTREAIYPLLREAFARQMLRLIPPLNTELARRIEAKFKCKSESVQVIETISKTASPQVAFAAADYAWGVINQLWLENRQPVGLGLGPGRATLDFTRRLAQHANSEVLIPHLKLYAISSGCPALLPEFSPTSFFNLLPTDVVKARIGMFAPPVVSNAEFKELRNRSGVKELFAAKEDQEIDIIVSSMGDPHDEHDLLRQLLLDSGLSEYGDSQKRSVGNVQFRPYTEDGPVSEREHELRAVTLYEIDELVQFSKLKDRHVILIARRCASCGMTRAKALRPLLTQPKLRLFTHLVIDFASARELLAI